MKIIITTYIRVQCHNDGIDGERNGGRNEPNHGKHMINSSHDTKDEEEDKRMPSTISAPLFINRS